MSLLDSRAAREYVSEERADVVARVDACADAVADSWDEVSVSDASLVSAPLEACLADADVLDELPDVLAGAVDAAGAELSAPPVAAPPYVVVTSRGPLLRATLDGRRLVVRIEAFRVTDDAHYERVETSIQVAVA